MKRYTRQQINSIKAQLQSIAVDGSHVFQVSELRKVNGVYLVIGCGGSVANIEVDVIPEEEYEWRKTIGEL